MNKDRRLIEAYLPIGAISVAAVVHRMPCALYPLAFCHVGSIRRSRNASARTPLKQPKDWPRRERLPFAP